MFERTVTKVIEEFSRNFRVLLLTGPRQVGKTTLLENMAKGNRRHITLDNVKLRALAQYRKEHDFVPNRSKKNRYARRN